MCRCVCVCPEASLPGVCRESLRDYSRAVGDINTAALNNGTALIPPQVAAFHKHRFIYSLSHLQFVPFSLQQTILNVERSTLSPQT